MQKNIKFSLALRYLGVIFLALTILTACNKKESKTTTESTEVKKDTLPALDDDSLSTTRPETIKN
jgi:hypothetical protein